MNPEPGIKTVNRNDCLLYTSHPAAKDAARVGHPFFIFQRLCSRSLLRALRTEVGQHIGCRRQVTKVARASRVVVVVLLCARLVGVHEGVVVDGVHMLTGIAQRIGVGHNIVLFGCHRGLVGLIGRRGQIRITVRFHNFVEIQGEREIKRLRVNGGRGPATGGRRGGSHR